MSLALPPEMEAALIPRGFTPDHPVRQYIPHTPQPKQIAGLLLPAMEVFYGGAAGGGKSDWLLMSALQYVDVPNYNAILFRRTHTDLALPGALIPRAEEWLMPTDAHWNAQDKKWTFPSGATLSFGYLDNEAQKYRYQSAEFQFVGFDELTQFSESTYRYLFSRLRRLQGVEIPIRMRGASNPGGTGHDWVYRRFVNPKTKRPKAIFLSAGYRDNVYLDWDSYQKSLNELDAVTRMQLRDGNWQVRSAGSMFNREWFTIVDESPADIVSMVRYWDLAATEYKVETDAPYTAGCLLGVTARGTFAILHMVRKQLSPAGVEKLVAQTAAMDGRRVPIYMEQEPGSAGVNTIHTYATKVLPGYIFHGDRPTGAKAERARPVSSQAEVGNIIIVNGPWIGDLLDELEAFPGGGQKDQVDAISGAFSKVEKPTYEVSYAPGLYE